MIVRAYCRCWLLIALTLWHGAAWSAEPEPPRGAAAPAATANRELSAGRLEYRQVFTPADQIEALSQGYFPLERERFQSLTALLENAGTGPPGETLARVAKAEYQARLAEDDLLVGEGEWLVEQSKTAPTLLRLDTCDLALSNVRWEGAAMTSGALGSGASGKPVALVRGAGKFLFHWSLRAQGEPGTVARFVLAWPSAGWIRLTLDLPADATPEVEGGLARELPAGPQPDAARRHWELLCGGRAQTVVQISRRREMAPPVASERLRQQFTYVVEERGGRFTAELELDAPAAVLRELPLEVSPDLRLTAAWYGDTALTWDKVANAAPTMQGSQTVRLNLPEGVAGANREVRVEGVFSLAAGTLAALPRLVVGGAQWQQGNVSLQVLRPLVLRQLRVTDARQTGAQPLSVAEGGEALEFQEFQRDARYEVDVGIPEPQINLESGAALEFNSAAESVRWEGEFTSNEGEQRTLTADLARAWVLEAVESQPADGVAHWTVEPRAPAQQRLTVQLNRAIRPGQSVRLLMRAHRPAAAVGAALSGDRLRFVEFQNVHVTERLLSLRAESPWRMVTEGQASLPLVEARQLTPAQARRVDSRTDAIILRDDGATIPAVTLASEPLRFTADFTLEVRAENHSLGETLRVRCSPEVGSIQRLIVLLAPGSRTAWRWSLADDATETVTARRLGGNGDGPLSTSETWELSWRRARSAPFELVAQREEEFTGVTPIALATAPAARSQTGSVLVFAGPEARVRVVTDRLKPLLVDSPGLARMPLMAALRYEPTEDPFYPAGALSLAPAAEANSATQGWAWSARHKIRISPGGEVLYVSTFRVENGGGDFEVALDEAAVLRETRLNGARVTLAGGVAPNSWKVVLPQGKHACTLEVEYIGQPVRLPAYGRLHLPLAQLNVPTYDGQAEVYLPADFSGLGEATARTTALAWNLWPQRAQPRPFRIFTGSDWTELVAGDAGVAAAQRLGKRSFAMLSSTWESRRGEASALTWGEFLVAGEGRLAALRDESGAVPRLLVDQTALRELGVGPGTTMAFREEPDLGRVLAGTNLVLLVSGDTLVLTSSAQASAWAGQWQWIGSEPYAAVLPGELAKLLAAAATAPTRLATVTAWNMGERESTAAAVLAPLAEPLGNRALPVVVTPVAGGAELSLVVFQPLVWQAWGWAVCLVATALAMLSARRSWLWVMALGAVSLSLSLFLPAPLAPLAQGAMLGVALGYVLTLVRVPTPGSLVVSPESSTVQALPIALGRSATLWLLVAVGWSWLTHTAHSAEEKPAGPTVYRVLVPVDDHQQPVGEYWYLQRTFYDTLLGRVAALQSGEEPWLLHSAQYQAEITERGTSEVTLQYALETLHSATTVRLPLRRAEVELIPDRAMLDGRTVALEWSADERALLLTVAEPGAHRLEVAVKPTRDKFENERGFEFTVPSVIESRLELLCTGPRAREVKAPSALGAFTVSPDDRRVTVALGPATQLAVRWPMTPGDSLPLVDATKDALYWLRIRPGSVVLNERVKLTVQRGEVKQLRLAAGPQLRLLPLPADHVLAEAAPDAAARGTYLLKFKQPITGDITFDLSYLVADLSGVGRLNVPLPKLEGVRANRRWLAVSPDATLECEAVGKPAAETVSPAQFVAAWGQADEAPALVARLSAGDRTWPISVRAREPRVKAAERTDVLVDREQTVVRYEAQVEVLASSLFQFRLQLPPGLEVERVTVREDKTPESARWSVSGSVLTVFLAGPANKAQTLLLEGTLPAVRGAAQSVPVVRLLDFKPAVSLVRVLRSAAVLAEVEVEPAAKPVTPATAPEVARGERLLGTWELPPFTAGAAAPLRLQATPNARQFNGRIATVVKRQREEWVADADVHLAVSQGVLDVVAIDLPAAWSEGIALVVDSTYPFALQELPDKSRRRMFIWPTEALRGAVHLHVRMRCQPGPGERLAAPRMTVPEAREVEEYLLLPERSDRQRITWETSGLRAARLPAGLVTPPEPLDRMLVLRTIEPEASASVARVEQALAQPLVRLVDVQVSWQSGGGYLGHAAYDLEPAQLTHVRLRMPEGTQFVRAESCGVVLAAEVLADGAIQCRLPVAQLPQRIDVVYVGDVGMPLGSELKFLAPEMLDTPVERTLWTVWPPAGSGAARPLTAAETPVFRQELYRLRSAAALVELGRSLVGERPAAEISSWYAGWARQIGRVERHVAQLERMPGGSDPFEAAEAGRLTATHDRTAAALGQTAARQRLLASGGAENGSGAIPCAPAWEGALTSSVEGAAPEFDVELARPVASPWPRWLAALALLVTVGLLFALRLQGPVGDWLVRWPHAACVIVGILAWMWFSPSLVGLLVVLLSAAAALAALVQTLLTRPAPA